MDVYRSANARQANDLSGEGARRAGGRWNRIGDTVLYTAASRALATLEVLVHIPLTYVPDDYRMLTLQLPDDSMQTLPFETLSDGWAGLALPDVLKQLISDWLAGNRFLVLKVPSAIVYGEYNFLTNPAHPRAGGVRIKDNRSYLFDMRLFN